MQSLLKKKASSLNNKESLEEFHERARRTVEVLTNNMVIGDASLEKIFEYY